MKNLLVKIFILITATTFCVTLYRALYVSAEESGIFPPPAGIVQSPPGTVPERLKIPSLSINAKVQQVGIAKSGSMAVPTNFSDVAWYKHGPVPGDIGNAVIDGHRDNPFSMPGVFMNLGSVRIGDDIYVSNDSGVTRHFKVVKKESVDYDTTELAYIFGPSDTANLILITCEGDWNQESKKYSKRLIVYSKLVK